jgi:hypothetical protein
MIEENLFVKCELFDEESLINHTFFQLHNKLILLDSLSAVDLCIFHGTSGTLLYDTSLRCW